MSDFLRLPGLLLATTTCSIGVAAPQPAAIAGVEQQTYEYQILREGVPVGSHQVLVESHGEQTRVASRSLIEIGLFGLTFYRFSYQSEEEWDAQGLRRLLVSVDDDGEHLEIDGGREGDRFHWSMNNEDPKTHEMPVFPTNHWNPAVLSQTRVLNTLTGGMNRVYIRPHREAVPPSDRDLGEVEKYRYSGDLELDSWYDTSGRWIGMRFEGRDGSSIEYRCRNCPVGRQL